MSSPQAAAVQPPNRERFALFNTLYVPINRPGPLHNIAAQAFRHYALYMWLVTHRQEEGISDAEVDAMTTEAEGMITNLDRNGPSSVYLALKDGYTTTPSTSTRVTERLILLALMAERPHLIPSIISAFPRGLDPIRLQKLLRPWTDPATFISQEAAIVEREPLDESQGSVLRSIAALGRIRVLHNIALRSAVKARYALLSIIADPYVFGEASLAEVTNLVTRCESLLIVNKSLYAPLEIPITTLRYNLNAVSGLLQRGSAISQDAIRRLRLILGVLDASDTLIAKLS